MDTVQIVVNVREVWLVDKAQVPAALKAIAANKERDPAVISVARTVSRQQGPPPKAMPATLPESDEEVNFGRSVPERSEG